MSIRNIYISYGGIIMKKFVKWLLDACGLYATCGFATLALGFLLGAKEIKTRIIAAISFIGMIVATIKMAEAHMESCYDFLISIFNRKNKEKNKESNEIPREILIEDISE